MVLRRRLAVMLATVMMLGVMSAAPALAIHHDGHANVKLNAGNKTDDGPDHNKGGGNDAIKTNNGKGND